MRRRRRKAAIRFVTEALVEREVGEIVPATQTLPPFRYLGNGQWEPVEIKVGDRVTWEGGLGWGNWCLGTAEEEASQPNETGVYRGFMVRPDGWDHCQFISLASLKPAQEEGG